MLNAMRISKSFKNCDRPVLDGVDLTVEDGASVAIMGPSGSGKSTLLYCLSGILRVDAGDVLFNETSLVRCPQRELEALRRSEFGFVFQAYNLVDALSALQNVMLPSLFGGARLGKESATRALSQVGLSGFERRFPAEMSGGQAQRVAIARALAVRREVVFADEPTGALDQSAGREVLECLGKIHDAGTTLVIVTHDPSVAASADRVLFLFDGQIVAEARGASSMEISMKLSELECRP